MAADTPTSVSIPGVHEPISGNGRGRIEAEIGEWAARERALYERYHDRRKYNHEICHRLAAGGVPPLAATVLRLGRWGQSGSVAEDVANWYAGLAQRLAAQESAIPLPARRQANDLVESLWKLARAEVDKEVAEPLRQTRAQLDEELAQAREQLAQARQHTQAQDEQLAAAGRENERLQRELGTSGAALLAEQHRTEALSGDIAALRLAQAQEVSELRQQHAEGLAQQKELHGDAQAQLRQQLDAAVERASAERTALLHRVDQAQVDARQWMAKAQEAQTNAQRALAELGDAKAAWAVASGELALGRAAEARLKEQLAQAVAAQADAGRSGVNVFLTQLPSCGLRLVRDFAGVHKPTRPDWMPEKDWQGHVLPLIGGAEGDGQVAVLQLLADKAKMRARSKK